MVYHYPFHSRCIFQITRRYLELTVCSTLVNDGEEIQNRNKVVSALKELTLSLRQDSFEVRELYQAISLSSFCLH